jgi:hypothetical protein
LAEILAGEGYETLLARTKKEKERQEGISMLSVLEVREILDRAEDIPEEGDAEGDLIIDIDSPLPVAPTGNGGSMENYEGMEDLGGISLSNMDTEELHSSFVSLESNQDGTLKKEKRGPRGGGSFGTSLNARKLGKKLGQGPPEGAATPVAKRQRVGAIGVGSSGGIGVGSESVSGQQTLGGIGHGQVMERDIHRDVGFLGGY